MSSKTSLQELIEKIDAMVEHGGDLELLSVKEHAKELLQKEKQQIMEAYDSGRVCRNLLLSSEYYVGQYGNQTLQRENKSKQNKTTTKTKANKRNECKEK